MTRGPPTAPGERLTAGHSLETALGAVRPGSRGGYQAHAPDMAPDGLGSDGRYQAERPGRCPLIARSGLEGNFQVPVKSWQAPRPEKEGGKPPWSAP